MMRKNTTLKIFLAFLWCKYNSNGQNLWSLDISKILPESTENADYDIGTHSIYVQVSDADLAWKKLPLH